MNRIRLLDDTSISKIAAGEVIERPSSVIKELVENSIDAGADNISIEIKEGGLASIIVSDNGTGMGREDARLSVQRHSTSKIRSADDLFSVTSLGFRGEALASIASVSKLTLSTNDGGGGTKISIEGGKIKNEASSGGPKGTTVEVEDLFFNTPARKKFQKSKGTETSQIVETVSRFILADPGISFKLTADGRKIISSLGNKSLPDAIASVYGFDMAKAMLQIKGGNGKIKVSGYVSQPVITKSDRYAESIVVNGRFVRNMLISKALEGAYRALIPSGKFPIAVIFIDIDPSDVDVNVHPTKREIKFAKADQVMQAVASAVSKTLSDIGAQASTPFTGGWTVGSRQDTGETIQIMDTMTNDQFQMTNGSSMANSRSEPLFQLALTYIIAAEGDDLLLIDQHAAHERILYERIKNRNAAGTQDLLVPISIEFDHSEFALISDNIEEMAELGFNSEAFGKNTILIRGVPAVLECREIEKTISEIVAEIGRSFKISAVEERNESIFKMMACKAAIKAGDNLSYQEMAGLIRDLKLTSNPTTCPHGRPTMARLSQTEFKKMFGR